MMGAEGKKVGNLYFAGEHTSLFFQGYMEGAAETGTGHFANVEALRPQTVGIHQIRRLVVGHDPDA